MRKIETGDIRTLLKANRRTFDYQFYAEAKQEPFGSRKKGVKVCSYKFHLILLSYL